jgi:hypothetical protein
MGFISFLDIWEQTIRLAEVCSHTVSKSGKFGSYQKTGQMIAPYSFDEKVQNI